MDPGVKWHQIRKNAEFLGCYKAIAHDEVEYRKDKYYNFRASGTRIGKPKGLDLPDGVTRKKDGRVKKKFSKYLDGPTQILGSLETMEPSGELTHGDPRDLALHKTLARCYQMAVQADKRYFALQFGGYCFGTNRKTVVNYLEKADQSMCVACKRVCPRGQKVCGDKCMAKSDKCSTKFKGACEAEDPLNNPSAGSIRGGYFTMTIYKIKQKKFDHTKELNRIEDVWKRFHYPKPDLSKGLNCPTDSQGLFKMSSTQEYMEHYFGPNSSTKGILMNHKAGTGKTCSMLNTMGNFIPEWNYIWVTRKSLMDVPAKEMYGSVCLQSFRAIIEDESVPLKYGSKEIFKSDEKLKLIRSAKGRDVLGAKANGGQRFVQYRVITYDNFVRFLSGKGTAEVKELFKKQIKGQTGKIDPLRKTVVVVDEAHNLVTPTFPADERKYLDGKPPAVPYMAESGKTGRDLIVNAFQHSYKTSGKNSVRCIMGTATPATSSVTELFWLLNLIEPNKKLHLKMDLDVYVDKANKAVKPSGIAAFAQIATGKISYFDNSRDPSKFPQKVVREIHHPKMLDFYKERARQIIRDVRLAKKLEPKELIELYQNLEFALLGSGHSYSAKQIEEYEASRDMKRTEDDIRKEYKSQLTKATKALNIKMKTADVKKYRELSNLYHKTLKKHNKDQVQKFLKGAVDGNNDLLPMHEWARKDVPENDAKVYAMKRASFTKAKAKWDKSEKGKAAIPSDAKGLTKDDGSLMSLEEWYAVRISPDRLPKSKVTLSKWEHFLITDPGTGARRIRTEEEYLAHYQDKGIVGGQTTPFSFVMNHRAYKPKLVRTILPYYAPDVYACIQNIFKLEESSSEKHVVLAFAGSSHVVKGHNNYGSKMLAGMFSAWDKFHVVLGYKYGGQGKGHTINYDVPEGKWGVLMLSTASVPNKKYRTNKGPQTVQYGPSIIKSTLEAFNHKDNLNGKRFKILLLDREFIEGVSTYDVAKFHAIGNPASRGQVEQSTARASRNCRSKNLPFYTGVGSFLDMYMYRSKYASSGSMSEDLLGTVGDELLDMNMIDTFQEMAKQMSLDFWLNQHTEYNPRFKGKVIAHQGSVLKVRSRLKTRSSEKSLDFLVPLSDVMTELPDKVEYKGVSYKVLGESKGHLNVADLETGSNSQLRKSEVRHPVGSEIEYKLPYGVDMITKLLNVGDSMAYERVPDVTAETIIKVHLPENAQAVTNAVFTGSVPDLMIGIAGILADVQGSVPLHVVLPKDAADDNGFGLLYKDGELMPNRKALAQFLGPSEGISFMVVFLAEPDSHDFHANLLIWVPEWKMIERFDPRGADHSTTHLDALLHDIFNTVDPDIRYMSAVASAPRYTLQRIQEKEKKGEKFVSAAFALLYMHMRIRNAVLTLDDPNKGPVYPRAFTESMIRELNQLKGGSRPITRYIQNYARNLVSIRQAIERWSGYKKDQSITTNTVNYISAVLKKRLRIPKTENRRLLDQLDARMEDE